MRTFAHPGENKTPTDLNELVKNTLIVTANEYKYVADIELDLGELPLVACNAGDLNQVLANLTVNAAHSIADVVQGTDHRGQITLRTQNLGNEVLITIADTGAGIPPEIADRVFNPFFTTKEVGRGTGQGLAIAHAIVVDRHAGSITYTTQIGHGTTFEVRLPTSDRNDRPGETEPLAA